MKKTFLKKPYIADISYTPLDANLHMLKSVMLAPPPLRVLKNTENKVLGICMICIELVSL